MSGRGRNSNRRGLKTTMVNVRMTPAELELLDSLKQSAPDHHNLVIESRADVIRRALLALAEKKRAAIDAISNQVG
jgi:hypothetical protein